MIRYAGAAVPWRLTVTGCAVITGLMATVAGWPWIMWPLQGTAVGVMAGLVAWAMDETCAGVVDTLPRSLRWRTIGRCAVVPLVLSVWIICLLLMRDRLPDHLGLFVGQGVAAAALALAVTGWRRSTGVAEPGTAFATLAIPIATACALVRPAADWLPLFPGRPDDNWALSRTIWSAVIVGSFALLTLPPAWSAAARAPHPAVGIVITWTSRNWSR